MLYDPEKQKGARLGATRFFQRKRLLIGLVTLVSALFLWFKFGYTSSESHLDVHGEVDELRALLYRLGTSQLALPEDLNVDIVHSPEVFAVGGPLEGSQLESYHKDIKAWHGEHPVVVFSKTYCPYSKRAKALLSTYPFKKLPVIIEADTRDDTHLIKGLLSRLTGHSTYPNIIIRGKTIGGSDNLQELHESGKLKKVLQAIGVL